MNSRLIKIWFLWLVLVLGCATEAGAREQKARDTLTDATALPLKADGALITDAHDIYRICNSRPVRLINGQGPKPHKQNSHNATVSQKTKTLFNRYDGVRRLPSAPFRRCAPCDYFVFALRRILC